MGGSAINCSHWLQKKVELIQNCLHPDFRLCLKLVRQNSRPFGACKTLGPWLFSNEAFLRSTLKGFHSCAHPRSIRISSKTSSKNGSCTSVELSSLSLDPCIQRPRTFNLNFNIHQHWPPTIAEANWRHRLCLPGDAARALRMLLLSFYVHGWPYLHRPSCLSADINQDAPTAQVGRHPDTISTKKLKNRRCLQDLSWTIRLLCLRDPLHRQPGAIFASPWPWTRMTRAIAARAAWREEDELLRKMPPNSGNLAEIIDM